MRGGTNHRAPTISGDEMEVVSRYRHAHNWCVKPGRTAWTKRKMRRRERQLAKHEIAEEARLVGRASL